MHEVGIMRQAVDLALSAARQNGGKRITRIRLEIGSLAGVAPDALAFAFEAVVDGTSAKGAVLEWIEIAVECRCEHGCPTFHPTGAVFRCPNCGVISDDVLHGRELIVAEIDVEP